MKAIQKSDRVLLALACVLLIAAFPVLFLYLQNADSVTLTQVLQPLLIFMGLSAALFLLVWPIVRSAGHAALITSVFVAVLENFAFLEKGIKVILPSLHYWHTLPIVLILCLAISYLIRWHISNSFVWDVVKIVTGVVSAMLIINFMTAIPIMGSNRESEDHMQQNSEVEMLADKKESAKEKPNLYLIIFDEFAGFKQAKNQYGFDNIELYEFLKNKGFTVFPDSVNESSETSVILTNLMNLSYIVDDDMSDTERESLRKNGMLYSLMREMGYDVQVIEATDFLGQYSPTRSKSSQQLTQNGESISDLCYQSTFVYPFIHINSDKTFLKILSMVDYLSSPQNTPKSPTMTVGYFIFPHPPFITDENGNMLPTSQYYNWADPQFYLGQYKYASKLIMKIVENIVSNDSDSVIMLMSDHGARGNDDYSVDMPLEYKINPLNAVYFRGESGEGLDGTSTLHTLRSLLERMFEIQLDPLESIVDIS